MIGIKRTHNEQWDSFSQNFGANGYSEILVVRTFSIEITYSVLEARKLAWLGFLSTSALL